MNVFYEEDGGFKVGTILADNDSSLQIEAPHGKRSKVKSSTVLLRFERLGLCPCFRGILPMQPSDELLARIGLHHTREQPRDERGRFRLPSTAILFEIAQHSLERSGACGGARGFFDHGGERRKRAGIRPAG